MDIKEKLKDVTGKLIMFAVSSYKKRTAEIVKIETAKHIINCAENTRISIRALVLALFAIGVMCIGAVMLISGIVMLILLWAGNTEYPEWFSLIYNTLIVGGLICFLPFCYVIFGIALSEEKWLDMVKNNRIVGPFVTKTLQDAGSK